MNFLKFQEICSLPISLHDDRKQKLTRAACDKWPSACDRCATVSIVSCPPPSFGPDVRSSVARDKRPVPVLERSAWG